MTGEIEKWADQAMFHAEPQEAWDQTTGVQPRVHLLSMNADPLGDIAAMAAMYEGRVIRSHDDLTDDDRRNYFEQISKSHLATPFEAVKLLFLIEGVDRAFTHQIVRKRIGTSFAQESMRFAVPGTLHQTVTIPPSLYGTHSFGPQWDQPGADPVGDIKKTADSMAGYDSDQQKMRYIWDDTIEQIDKAYHALVNMGMPAEEARGLLPTAVATRIQFGVTLNTLFSMAGERLCTQAQFHWRSVLTQMVQAIREYGDAPNVFPNDEWQFRYLADCKHFKPVCYQLGRCPWKASFDRGCTIRKRVDYFAANGIPGTEWSDPDWGKDRTIKDEEWRLNPYAAIVRSDEDRP